MKLLYGIVLAYIVAMVLLLVYVAGLSTQVPIPG